jgi:steroid delta-isomerase-like uncharacterized protein
LSEEAYILEFCRRWLPAWTGNDPELLLQFYAENVVYIDPAHPEGLEGQEQLKPYLQKLLAANPNWIWEVVEVFPTPRGFTLKWRATIPVGQKKLVEHGMDIVELENGKITRNEVYFDRSRWLEALPKKVKKK